MYCQDHPKLLHIIGACYCHECGEGLSKDESCPHCHKEVQPNFLYCPFCGKPCFKKERHEN